MGLPGLDLYEEMLKFYDEFYSAGQRLGLLEGLGSIKTEAFTYPGRGSDFRRSSYSHDGLTAQKPYHSVT